MLTEKIIDDEKIKLYQLEKILMTEKIKLCQSEKNMWSTKKLLTEKKYCWLKNKNIEWDDWMTKKIK